MPTPPQPPRDPGRLDRREPRPRFRDLAESASDYQPPDGLVDAAEIAVALGSPLLITGEPGTGKTQAAYYLAWHYGVPDERFFRLDVRSSTTDRDLTANLDTIAYFHAAHDPQRAAVRIDPRDHYIKGPLYRAYREATAASVVLIDEIDKAPRDFPNDLLNTLDQHEFTICETQDTVTLPDEMPPPLVVITSNTERRLPEPFLRRCIYHHIEFDRGLLERAVEAHIRHLDVDKRLVEHAIARFIELRDPDLELQKRPSTGELLKWLYALRRMPSLEVDEIKTVPLGELPALTTLVKHHEDLIRLRRA
jgi:MoxR-like ATPase